MVANPILDGQHEYIGNFDLKKDLECAQMQGIAKTLDDKQIVDLSKAFAKKYNQTQSNPALKRRAKPCTKGETHVVMVLS